MFWILDFIPRTTVFFWLPPPDKWLCSSLPRRLGKGTNKRLLGVMEANGVHAPGGRVVGGESSGVQGGGIGGDAVGAEGAGGCAVGSVGGSAGGSADGGNSEGGGPGGSRGALDTGGVEGADAGMGEGEGTGGGSGASAAGSEGAGASAGGALHTNEALEAVEVRYTNVYDSFTDIIDAFNATAQLMGPAATAFTDLINSVQDTKAALSLEEGKTLTDLQEHEKRVMIDLMNACPDGMPISFHLGGERHLLGYGVAMEVEAHKRTMVATKVAELMRMVNGLGDQAKRDVFASIREKVGGEFDATGSSSSSSSATQQLVGDEEALGQALRRRLRRRCRCRCGCRCRCRHRRHCSAGVGSGCHESTAQVQARPLRPSPEPAEEAREAAQRRRLTHVHQQTSRERHCHRPRRRPG